MLVEKYDSDASHVYELMRAWQAAPNNTRPLKELVEFFKARGDKRLALIFSLIGAKTDSKDWEFDFEAIKLGMQFGKRQQAQARAAADQLIRSQSVPFEVRQQLKEQMMAPKITFKSLEVWRNVYEPELPEGWSATNPSILSWRGKYFMAIRAVNYLADLESGGWSVSDLNGVSRSKCFFATLNESLRPTEMLELERPIGFPTSAIGCRPLGLEDMRLFPWKEEVWGIATTSEHNSTPRTDMIVTCLGDPNKWWIIRGVRDEKNWMPMLDTDGWFVRCLSPLSVVNGVGRELLRVRSNLPVGLRGSSQVLRLGVGKWLCMVHEGGALDRQRFCLFDLEGNGRVSEAFHFVDPEVEFVGGLCQSLTKPEKLVVSFGVRDRECWFATFELKEVLECLSVR